MKTFKEYKIESLIVEGLTSQSLSTIKSPVNSIDIIKYKEPRYGILNFSMQKEARKFLTSKGFSLDRTTHYPYKAYQNRDEMLKDLKELFGIDSKLVNI